MSQSKQKDVLEALCEQLHLNLAQQLIELIDGMSLADNDPRILTAAIKFLSDNGITLETGHYVEGDVPGSEPAEPSILEDLKNGVLPFNRNAKSASS